VIARRNCVAMLLLVLLLLGWVVATGLARRTFV
jgi:hypothetical protein